MGKLIGIIAIALGVWLGLELYVEGAQNAFGGALAAFGGAEEDAAAPHRTAPQRAGDAVRGALDLERARRERLLPE